MTKALLQPKQHDAAVFGKVAVLMGGTSSEREVALKSGAAVLGALQAQGVDAHGVDGLPALLQAHFNGQSFDRVFNVMHGGDGENGVLQGTLRALGVPFTGSDVLGCALTLDKARTKQIWQANRLPTPRFITVTGAQALAAVAAEIGFPVFVKPACEGSSVGVFQVLDAEALAPAQAFAAQYQGELLVEQMVQGEELTVPVIDGMALPSVRIVPKTGWYDYEAKYLRNDTQYICPAFDGEEEAQLGRLAEAAFAAAGCTGWGRVDVMRDRRQGFQLIEINTAPGMTATSLVPKSANVLGVSFEQLCWYVLEQTL